MAKKKKKKKAPQPKSPAQEQPSVEEVTDIKEVPLVCTCVGQTMAPAGANFKGVVKSQRYVKSLGILMVYFENGYCCNSQICRVVKEK